MSALGSMSVSNGARALAWAALALVAASGCYTTNRNRGDAPGAREADAGTAGAGESGNASAGGHAGSHAAAGSDSTDAGGIDIGSFELTCGQFTTLPRPACAECLGTVQLTCSATLSQFAETCGPAERCASRNCMPLCPRMRPCDGFCDCAISCLPAGESPCKALWQQVLSCYVTTCERTC
jgi:hypothetical protein